MLLHVSQPLSHASLVVRRCGRRRRGDLLLLLPPCRQVLLLVLLEQQTVQGARALPSLLLL
jgi:hypothetical protein